MSVFTFSINTVLAIQIEIKFGEVDEETCKSRPNVASILKTYRIASIDPEGLVRDI